MELTRQDIEEILRIFSESEMEELRLEVGETRLYLTKGSGSPDVVLRQRQPADRPRQQEVPEPKPGAPTSGSADSAVAPAEGLVELTSPLLGTFYRRPSPDQPPFVELGSHVDADDPVCIIDVMKMFTRVKAGVGGRVAQICVEDGELVRHGQLLMRFEPA